MNYLSKHSIFISAATVCITLVMIIIFILTEYKSSVALEEESDLIVIGFSQVGAESDWRIANTESIKTTFSYENGYELIFSDARQKQENQIMAIRTFIQQDVDYIILAPVTELGWDSVLQEAKDAQIPVIVIDRQIEVEDNSLYTCRIGSDFGAVADLSMKWLENELSGRQEEINVLHLVGTIGATAQIHRTKSLESAVAKNDNWFIVQQLYGDFTEAKAYEVTDDFLKTTSTDLDVIYCENDNMTFGVMRALDKHGITYGEDGQVILISFDAGAAALEACINGDINICLECNPILGPLAEKAIIQLEEGLMPQKEYYMDETFFTSKTITIEEVNNRVY